MNKKIVVFGLLLAILAGAFLLRGYNAYRFHVESQTRFLMDTLVTIYVVGPQKTSAPAVRSAFDRMQAVDGKFSALNPDGPVYAFNHYHTAISDPDIIAVVSEALEIAKLTDGAFDITVAPLIELWGFYGDNPAVPPDADIQGCLQQTGFRHLHIQEGRLIKDNGNIKIDLGGIAKGFAIRQAADALKAGGIQSAMINAGGDVYALGKRGRKLWKVGIRNPRGEDLLGILEVENLAVMGSGDYHRFFMAEGIRYHHIFDPKTGYPARGLISTTLIHSDPMIADAWNTAIFILGQEKGLALVEQQPDMEAVMVTESGKLVYTSGLTKILDTNNNAKQIQARRIQ